jgi:hypothetical protein
MRCDHDDMGNNFLEVALSWFGFLSGSGTYQLTQQEASSSFDNGRLYFESSILHLHIVRERSAWLVEFASSAHPIQLHWYDFDLVRRFLDGATHYQLDAAGKADSSVPVNSAEAVAALLDRYLSLAELAFAAGRLNETESSLDALRRERVRLMWPVSVPGSDESSA